MWLLRAALRNPISIVVIVIGVALCSVLALTRMPIDIFPNLNLPVIYVAQPYGGMSPAQMEGYLVYYYEYHFLYITGIESVESKSIQNVGLLKLTFHPGTDMSQAMAQTVGYVDRARAFMPPGTVAPFIMRFDAGSVPVGYLVFSSTTKSVAEIQDLALNRVRPLFATLPGVSAPPPFGGAARTIVVSVDPDRLRAYRMAPDEVIQALNTGNTIVPAGKRRTAGLLRPAPVKSLGIGRGAGGGKGEILGGAGLFKKKKKKESVRGITGHTTSTQLNCKLDRHTLDTRKGMNSLTLNSDVISAVQADDLILRATGSLL